MPTGAMILFVILIFAFVIWLVLMTKLFKHLRDNHEEVYEAMGRPTTFVNNSPRHSIEFLRFIYARKHKDLHDDKLSCLSDFMMIYCTLCYMLVLVFGFWSNSGAT